MSSGDGEASSGAAGSRAGSAARARAGRELGAGIGKRFTAECAEDAEAEGTQAGDLCHQRKEGRMTVTGFG